MKKIKIVGFLMLLLSMILILLFALRSNQEHRFTQEIDLIYAQKSHTQEVAKAIFYTQRNKQALPDIINKHMYSFLSSLKSHALQKKGHPIQKLGQEYFELVHQFKHLYTGDSSYNILILDKLVNAIYKKNMDLVMAFNQELATREKNHTERMKLYTMIQYALFACLLLMLLYIFTQIGEIVRFIQKFTSTSERIIEKATIKGTEPIAVHSHNSDLATAADNFNTLVSHIDESIKIATANIENSTNALEIVERNIELLIALVHQMQKEEKEAIYKKEDAVIESLETLMGLSTHLEILKKELQKLL